ncbi:MAG: hypothetical protein PUI62_02170 [Spirochaetales bacterium]|nr:hypothetical protein [Spirochaetales bacterium]
MTFMFPKQKRRPVTAAIYILQLRDGAFPHLRYNRIYTYSQEKCRANAVLFYSIYEYSVIIVFYLPPFKALNKGGQIFLITIPIPVPITIVKKVGIKYWHKLQNVLLIGKNQIHSFEVYPFTSGA